jgi:sulfite exporter TauE/SafE
MCGPIALGIASRANGNRLHMIWHHLLYFGGKTLTYMFIGLVFGLFGHGLVLAGMQQALSVIMGSVMVLLAIVYITKTMGFHQTRLTVLLQNRLVPVFSQLLSRPGIFTPFYLGLLNGLLPCGLVYIALAGAIATGNSFYAATYMGLFGLATMPVMLTFMVFSGQLAFSYKTQLQKIAPVLIGAMGMILLLRGLNLGIPFLSPVMDALMLPADKSAEAVGCHP